MCLFPFARKPSGEPVSLPGLRAKNVREAKANEPRRGPCAHVSLVVVAVGSDWLARIQPVGGAAIQGLERDVEGARDMFGFVLAHGENIHELGALLNKVLDGMTVNHCGHVYLYS